MDLNFHNFLVGSFYSVAVNISIKLSFINFDKVTIFNVEKCLQKNL